MSDPSATLDEKVEDLYLRVGALALAFGGLMEVLESEGSPVPAKVIAFLQEKKAAALDAGLGSFARRIEDILPKQ